MKKVIIFGLLISTLVILPLLGACAEPEQATTPAPATTTPATTTPEPTTPATTTPEPTTPAATEPTTASPSEAHWWDKFGEPQYGGTLTIAWNMLPDDFDPYNPYNSNCYPYEQLFMWDMTLDRDVWSYKTMGIPPSIVGLLAESWEWEDPQTLVVHLQQGVKWQNKQPTFGRELTADDVVYHYDRVLGTGEFTEPNPFNRQNIEPLVGVSARDKYTVVMEFKDPNPLANWWALGDPASQNMIEPREMVEAGSGDWENAAGTGAFMVTDFVSGNSLTLGKNPDYHRYDERYPENKLPYLDEVKLMLIMDPSTQLAAIRSGQVDMVLDRDWMTAENLKKTNPDLMVTQRPFFGLALSLRVDTEPFTDIRVRKALQLAVDTQTIAQTHYGGYVDGHPAGYLTTEYKGWALPYEEWPEDLQQEYTYDPEQAKQLLAEAGYPDGFETNCYVATSEDIDLMQIAKSYFADIGVDMTINTMDRNDLMGFTQARKYDQMVGSIYCNCIFPPKVVITNRVSWGPNNDICVGPNPYDDIYAEFAEATDEATAQKLMIEANEYALRQHWQVMNTGRAHFDITQPHLKGFSGEDTTGGGAAVFFWTRFWLDQG